MRTLLAIGLVGAVGACSKSPPAPGKVVAIGSVCNETDGARVRLTGTVRYERGLLSFCSNMGGHKTCDLSLYDQADKPAAFDVMNKAPEAVHVKISVPVGTSPGEMTELPDKFTASDIVVHLPGKNTATEGSRVTLDGSVSVVPGTKNCFVNVEWASGG